MADNEYEDGGQRIQALSDEEAVAVEFQHQKSLRRHTQLHKSLSSAKSSLSGVKGGKLKENCHSSRKQILNGGAKKFHIEPASDNEDQLDDFEDAEVNEDCGEKNCSRSLSGEENCDALSMSSSNCKNDMMANGNPSSNDYHDDLELNNDMEDENSSNGHKMKASGLDSFKGDKSEENSKVETSLLSASSLSLSPSVKSSSSSTASSLSNNHQKLFQPAAFTSANANSAAAEWYKQYELFSQRNAAVLAAATGLQQYLKPERPLASQTNSPNGMASSNSSSSVNQVQSSPSSTSGSSVSGGNMSSQGTPQSNESSLLMDRFSSPFSNILKQTSGVAGDSADKLLAASQQALLAQYAQQFYLNGGQNGIAGLVPPTSGPGSGPLAGFSHSTMAAAAAAMAAAAASSNGGANGTNNGFNHHSSSSSSSLGYHHGNGASSSSVESQLEKERERYLASLNLYHQHHQNSTSSPSFAAAHHAAFNQHMNGGGGHQRLQNDSPTNPSQSSMLGHDQMEGAGRNSRMKRRGNSSGSRSPSPSSSQMSGNGACEDEDDDCDDNQSLNAANGEWTYEEQFKQVSNNTSSSSQGRDQSVQFSLGSLNGA